MNKFRLIQEICEKVKAPDDEDGINYEEGFNAGLAQGKYDLAQEILTHVYPEVNKA